MTWLAALGMGLLGSVGHCLGMCGPVAGAVGVAAGARSRDALPAALAYNAGRLTTYGAIGFAMGLAGSFVNVAARLAGLQDAIATLAGGLMILLGLATLGVARAGRDVEQRVAGRVFRAARAVLAGGGASRGYPLGLLLGFLPCGLSYSAFLAAAATGHPLSGLAVALAFGLGTAPALLLAGTLAGALSARARGVLSKAGGALVVFVGAGLVLRGLGFHAHV